MGCKWSSFNAPGTGNPLSHIVLGLDYFPFFPLLALWDNKNWPPSMKVKKLKNFQNKRGLMGCKGSSLNAPGTGNPLSHSVFGFDDFPFSHYWPSGVIRIGLPV